MSDELLFSMLVLTGCAMLGMVALWAYVQEEPLPVEDEPDPWTKPRRKPRYYVNGSTIDHAAEARRRREQDRRRRAGSGRRSPPAAPPPPAPWTTVLGIGGNAGQREIRRAYVKLMKSLHPDLVAQTPQTSARCAEVQSAYDRARADAVAAGRF